MNAVYDQVAARIVKALEAGTPPWLCPFARLRQMPYNVTTGKTYQGVNVLLLWLTQMDMNYPTNGWLTYKQMLSVGGTLKPKDAVVGYRKGDQETTAGIRMVEWAPKDLPPAHDGSEQRLKAVRFFNVFNVAQIDNLPEQMYERPAMKVFNEVDAYGLDVLMSLSGIASKTEPCVPNYNRATDTITMPEAGWFHTVEDYYATKLHEMVHATGHPSRLDRHALIKEDTDAEDWRAYEELVAEIGSAFLCAQFGIEGKLQHEAYIGSWVQHIKKKPNAIVSAASQASKAADFILSLPERAAKAA